MHQENTLLQWKKLKLECPAGKSIDIVDAYYGYWYKTNEADKDCYFKKPDCVVKSGARKQARGKVFVTSVKYLLRCFLASVYRYPVFRNNCNQQKLY